VGHVPASGPSPHSLARLPPLVTSQLVIGGAPLRQVQEWLGHSTITMTMRYAHLAPSGGREYLAAERPPRYPRVVCSPPQGRDLPVVASPVVGAPARRRPTRWDEAPMVTGLVACLVSRWHLL
jgi:hypothetical protein